MPTLFISYKRGTAGIIPLMERLRAEHYRLWYDKDDIHAGENWRESINHGVDTCDALIVGLTPDACKSEFVRYEVKRAIKQGKLIFPVKMEAIDESKDPQQLGLTDIQFIDFTTSDPATWNTAFKKLLSDMQRQDVLKITNRVIRKERGTEAHMLHQRYLSKLLSRIGTLSLANISPDVSGTVQLEDVYIDSPTNLSISLEVKDWHVVDWWLNTSYTNPKALSTLRTETKSLGRKFSGVRFDDELMYVKSQFERQAPASLEALIGDIDAEIQEYRADNPELKADDEISYPNQWNNGKKENYLTLEIQDIATAQNRLVVLGQPGSGKSTFVKYLALCLAGEQIDDWTRDAQLSGLRHWLHGDMTPMYIELRHFVNSAYFPSDIHTQPTENDFWQYIEKELLGEDLLNYLPELKYDVEQGHAIIIFDGLDEVPYPEGQLTQRQQQIISLAEIVNGPRFAKCRVIVASRPYAYEGWKLPNFEVITIADFTDTHRLQLASKLYKASGLTQEQAQEKAQALNGQLSNIDPQLKDRPLFLTLMATVYLHGEEEGLPTRRGALYRESVMLLMDRWTSSKRTGAVTLIDILGGKSTDELYERLSALAFDVHNRYEDQQGTPEIDIGLLYKHLMPLGYAVGGQLIPYLSENAGILVSPGQDEEKDVFHFAHRTFQEYLAASHIAKTCIEADSYKLVYRLITAKPQTWRIPCALVGDVLADIGRKSELWALLADLLEDEPPQEQKHPAWFAGWLAGEISTEQELHLQEKLNRRTEQPIREGLVEWLFALIEQEALPPIERASCGRTLALLGDPREGVGLRSDGLPDIVWGKQIPAGKYKIGGDIIESLPTQEVNFSYSYKLAKYPVTVAQFNAFIEARDGIHLDKWWINLPTSARDYVAKRPYNMIGNYPISNISWYEAVAYCRWLTAQYHAIGLLESNFEIRLPIEQEWETAARYPNGHLYAYEGDGDFNKMNVSDTQIRHKVSVGLFPSGRNIELDLYDLNGNVSEWCLNEYLEAEKVDFMSDMPKTIRSSGGDIIRARSDYREPDSGPFMKMGYIGIRLCFAPIHALLSETSDNEG